MSAIHFRGQLLTIYLSLESPSLDINHLAVTYGQQLRITMTTVTEKLLFTSVNKQQSYIIWSRHIQPKKGQVTQSGDERCFIINAVTFDDQGNYTEWNFWDKVTSVHLVTVLCKFFPYIHFSLFFLCPSQAKCLNFSNHCFLN